MALGAQPTTDVVVSVVSDDTTEATVNVAQLTFTNANWSTTQTVTVTGVNDALGDGNQTPAVTLAIVDASSDNCFDSAADTVVSVRVSDDDSAGFTVVETGGSIAVTEASTVATATVVGNTDTFTVVLNKAPTSEVVVNVTSSDTGEAIVSASSLTFTSANWDTPQTVTVTGVNDTDIDGTQSLTVTLAVVDASSDDTYDTIADYTISASVADDDAPVVTTTTVAPPTTTLPPPTTTQPPAATPSTGEACDPAPYVNCRNGDLSNRVVIPSDLSYANLNGANMTSAILFYGNLRGANLRGWKLQERALQGTDLSHVDLREARLEGALLQGARMRDTRTLQNGAPTGKRLVKPETRTTTTHCAWWCLG